MNLLPFDSVKECPKCGLSVEGHRVKYGTFNKVEVGDGEFAIGDVYGSKPQPHLEKHCPHCRYGWLERTKDAV